MKICLPKPAIHPDANLAEFIEDQDLDMLSSDLISGYENNKASRQEWEDTYIQGLDLLGFKIEDRETPFPGASGVTHPLLSEAVTQFQAQAFKELLPAKGPVKAQVMGAATPDVQQQAARVQDFMNYQITSVMEEYTPERWTNYFSIYHLLVLHLKSLLRPNDAKTLQSLYPCRRFTNTIRS